MPLADYVPQRRRDRRETFIPLAHDPGERLECDFGHIYVDFLEGRKAVPVFLAVWSYSNGPFAVAMPTERVEAILYGMVEAFAFFDRVPHEVWWDNPKTVVTKIFRGRERADHMIATPPWPAATLSAWRDARRRLLRRGRRRKA
jgi:transposase